MPKRTIAQPKRALAEEDVRRYAEEYLKARRLAEEAQKRADAMKSTLVQHIVENGYTDDKGSQYIDVGIPGCAKLKRERRLSQRFNEEKAAAWLERKGVYDEYTETIVVLSEDKILAAGWEKKIPERVIKGFYDDNEVMAFKVVA